MITKAGTKPARNSVTADVFVTCAITIMKMAGGTSMPIAVPAAIIEAEGIEPSEDELLEAVGQAADGGSPKKLLERLKSAGRLDALKEDLAQRKALDVVADSAKPVAAEATASS